MTIWGMRIACWIRKATNTNSEYVTLFAFPLLQRLHGRPAVLRYTYIACLVKNFGKEELTVSQASVLSGRDDKVHRTWRFGINRINFFLISNEVGQTPRYTNECERLHTPVHSFMSSFLADIKYFVNKS
jgi:hypothetical protein